jgi:hypothetical protein
MVDVGEVQNIDAFNEFCDCDCDCVRLRVDFMRIYNEWTEK